MCGESTSILSGSIAAFEMFMSLWERLSERHLKLSQWIDIGMDKATEYYRWMDCTSAYIMLMCKCLLCEILKYSLIIFQVLNPSICLNWVWKHWSAEYIEDAEQKIKAIVSCINHLCIFHNMLSLLFSWPNTGSRPAAGVCQTLLWVSRLWHTTLLPTIMVLKIWVLQLLAISSRQLMRSSAHTWQGHFLYH
jgi:hypothetical protein